jgi:hypothetical protein
MSNIPGDRVAELRDIVDQKISALVREMEDADWKAEDVAGAISDIVRRRWLEKSALLSEAREAVAANSISDGNEG